MNSMKGKNSTKSKSFWKFEGRTWVKAMIVFLITYMTWLMNMSNKVRKQSVPAEIFQSFAKVFNSISLGNNGHSAGLSGSRSWLGGLDKFEFLVGLIDEFGGCLGDGDGSIIIEILESECFTVLLSVDQASCFQVRDVSLEEVACCGLNGSQAARIYSWIMHQVPSASCRTLRASEPANKANPRTMYLNISIYL